MYALLYISPFGQHISAEYRGVISDTYPSYDEAERAANLMNRLLASKGRWGHYYRPIPLPSIAQG